jgi:hypothetical protein
MEARIPFPFDLVAQLHRQELRRKIIPARADLDGEFFRDSALAETKKKREGQGQDAVTEWQLHGFY